MGVGGIFLRSLFLRIPVIELFRATLIITFMKRIKEIYRLCWHYKISSDFYYKALWKKYDFKALWKLSRTLEIF